MTLAIIAAPTAREGQLSWLTAALASRVKRNVMQALCPQRPPHRPAGAGKSMLTRRLTAILPAVPLAEALEATPLCRVLGSTGAHGMPSDLAGVELTHAAQVDRKPTPTPPSETARCPHLRLPPHVMGASPSREGTRNTYE
jgi:Magnesium chelatase, subunit ChlI